MAKTRSMTTMIRLEGVKIGRNCVYLEKDEGLVRVSPLGKAVTVVQLMDRFKTKGEKRKFRKTLFALGHRDLAAQTVPPKLRPINMNKHDLAVMRDRGYTDAELRDMELRDISFRQEHGM